MPCDLARYRDLVSKAGTGLGAIDGSTDALCPSRSFQGKAFLAEIHTLAGLTPSVPVCERILFGEAWIRNLMTLLIWAVGLAFLIYGGLCLTSMSMVEDFHRFGLERLRILTGFLEVVGGSGLLIGMKWRPALTIFSGGLCLLMLIAFCVRVKMRDGVAESLPSLTLMLITAYVSFKSLHK